MAVFIGAEANATEPDDEDEEAIAAVVVSDETESDSTEAPSPIAAPTLEDWSPRFEALGPAHRDVPYRGFDVLAVATDFDLPVYVGWKNGRRSIAGRTFRGSAFSSRRTKYRCSDRGRSGRWYEISTPGHYVCTASGYRIKAKEGRLHDQLDPNLGRPLPFQYARVTEEGTLRLSRLPKSEEELQMLRDRSWKRKPRWIVEVVAGDYFLALDHEVEAFGERFYRTVRGQYVKSDTLDLRHTPPLQGEHLGPSSELPIAFVHGEEPVELKCNDEGSWINCATAYKHDRMQLSKRAEISGRPYWVGDAGYAAPADRLRIAKKRRRPGRIDEDEKWIHVDLSEQTLVAYEGDKPVFATLVSSGKEGYETPTGLYRVKRKYTTKLMRGKDKEDGRTYHIEDIPWIMYYYHTYALHGAYWHNTFGNVRSHGCTNIAPADARWLFHWADPEVRWGWHARFVSDGTYVFFEE